MVTVLFIEDTVEPNAFLPGIISLVIMCIGIIWNNSFFSRRTRPRWGSNRSSATANVTLYCTWRPSGLTIGLHGQGLSVRNKRAKLGLFSVSQLSNYRLLHGGGCTERKRRICCRSLGTLHATTTATASDVYIWAWRYL